MGDRTPILQATGQTMPRRISEITRRAFGSLCATRMMMAGRARATHRLAQADLWFNLKGQLIPRSKPSNLHHFLAVGRGTFSSDEQVRRDKTGICLGNDPRVGNDCPLFPANTRINSLAFQVCEHEKVTVLLRKVHTTDRTTVANGAEHGDASLKNDRSAPSFIISTIKMAN